MTGPRYNGVVSLRNMHPDLRLGLVLATAAVLLGLGNPGKFSAAQAVLQLDLSRTAHGLLLTVGGLAVIGVAIWVDRRPPHSIMAAGTLVALFGLLVLSMPASIGAFGVGMFVAGVGRSAVNPLIFYAIAVRGASRYRGTMIGALGTVFLVSSDFNLIPDWQVGEYTLSIPVIVAFSLAGAALLFFVLPRVFTGAYEPGQPLKANPGIPAVWRALIWLTIVYSVASVVRLTIDVRLLNLTTQSTSGLNASELQLLTVTVLQGVSAVGILLWGAASDLLAVRRCLLLVALLYLLGAGATWVFGGLPVYMVGLVAVGLAQGGLICLPLILMAELFPTRHFVKLAVLIQYVGIAPGAILGGLLLTVSAEAESMVLLLVGVEALALSIIAVLLPRPRMAEEHSNDS